MPINVMRFLLVGCAAISLMAATGCGNKAAVKDEAVVVTANTTLSLVTEGFGPVKVHEPATFEITLANTGPRPAEDVVVVYTLPPEVIVVENHGGEAKDNTVTWTMDSLPAGAVRKLAIKLTMTKAGFISGMTSVRARNVGLRLASSSIEVLNADGTSAPLVPLEGQAAPK